MKEIIVRPKSPCLKDCEDRTSVCKRSCKKYKEYEGLYKEYSELRGKQANAYSDYTSYKEKLIHRARKRTRKKY